MITRYPLEGFLNRFVNGFTDVMLERAADELVDDMRERQGPFFPMFQTENAKR